MTPCSALSGTRRFGGTYRLHLQGRRIVQQTSEQAGGVISQKKILFKTTAVKTSNPTNVILHPTVLKSTENELDLMECHIKTNE
jgi:hypothetical protein